MLFSGSKLFIGRKDAGQGAAEYTMIIGILCLGVCFALTYLGMNIETALFRILNHLSV